MWSTHQEKEHFFLSEALYCIQKNQQYTDIPAKLAQNILHSFAPHAKHADIHERATLKIIAETHKLHDLYEKLFSGEHTEKA